MRSNYSVGEVNSSASKEWLAFSPLSFSRKRSTLQNTHHSLGSPVRAFANAVNFSVCWCVYVQTSVNKSTPEGPRCAVCMRAFVRVVYIWSGMSLKREANAGVFAALDPLCVDELQREAAQAAATHRGSSGSEALQTAAREPTNETMTLFNRKHIMKQVVVFVTLLELGTAIIQIEIYRPCKYAAAIKAHFPNLHCPWNWKVIDSVRVIRCAYPESDHEPPPYITRLHIDPMCFFSLPLASKCELAVFLSNLSLEVHRQIRFEIVSMSLYSPPFHSPRKHKTVAAFRSNVAQTSSKLNILSPLICESSVSKPNQLTSSSGNCKNNKSYNGTTQNVKSMDRCCWIPASESGTFPTGNWRWTL